MSGTWSRKRRSAGGTSSVPAPVSRPSTAVPLRPPDAFPLTPAMQYQQVLLSRSTERMFEDAELSGVLSLAGRKLKSFPTTMADKYDISDLVAADLSSNRLADVPPDVCEFRSLESLRICHNSLRRIPSNISLLQALVYLDLSNNQLCQLPQSLFDLPLEILLLTGNRFESIPREIRNLSSTLTELDLGHNCLKTIPADIALLKMLRVLSLRKNFLDQFPSELCRLSLSCLDLSSNQFTQLPLHIRKMKTLVEFYIHDNPLQTPPITVIEKGREHIFKWMDTASGGGQLTPTRVGTGTLRARGDPMGRSVLVSTDELEHMRKTSVPERRSRATRFHTITGSDSGYASTAEEHRLSHELGPAVLDDINEYSVFSCSPDEGIQVVEASSSESVSLKSQDSFCTGSSAPLPPAKVSHPVKIVPNTPMKPVKTTLAPLAAEEDTISSPLNNKTTVTNGNSFPAEKRSSLDLKNNNTVITMDAYSTQPPTAVVAPTRPTSKVAPIMNNTRRMTASATTVDNKLIKSSNTVSKLSPPGSKARSMITIAGNKKESPPLINATKRQPVIVPQKTTSSRLPHSTAIPSTSTGIKKSPAESKILPEKKVEPVKKTSMLKSITPETGSGPIETVRKLFLEQIGLNLGNSKETIAGQLSDGIHLCNLVNALRPRTIPTVMTGADNSPLSPMKAKRNADSFVTACRRAGVPEASLCSSADILAKKNLPALIKTISALSRQISSTPARNSTDRLVTNV